MASASRTPSGSPPSVAATLPVPVPDRPENIVKLVGVALLLFVVLAAGIYAGYSSPLLGKVLALSLTSAALVGFYHLSQGKPPSTILANALKSCLVGLFLFGALDLAAHGPSAFGLPSDLPYNDLCQWGGSSLLAATGAIMAKKFLTPPPLPPPLLTAEEQATIDNAELVCQEDLDRIGDTEMHAKTIVWNLNGYRISGQLSATENHDPRFLPYMAAHIEKVVLPEVTGTAFENIHQVIQSQLQISANNTGSILHLRGTLINNQGGVSAISIRVFPQKAI